MSQAVNALEIHHLTKGYSGFSLEDVSLTLPKGCIMGLIGENGAGKTTTIKAALGLIAKDSGDVSILGMEMPANEQAAKAQIGVVLDDGHFHENLTPKEIGKILKTIYPTWDDSLYQQYLKRFSLPFDQRSGSFSKGMGRKLAIAAALAHRPKLLIMDEATSGLDPVVREEILDILLEFIEDEEHAVLLSSHITSDLDKIADYITFLHEGKVVLSREKDDLLSSMGILKCSEKELKKLPAGFALRLRQSQFGCEVLVQNRRALSFSHPGLTIDPATLEDMMLFYIRGKQVSPEKQL